MTKKLVFFFCAVVLSSSLTSAGAGRSYDRMTVLAQISEDGKSFVSDSDHKTWTIANPGAIKGHEGHHVRLTATRVAAHADPRGGGEVRIISVKRLHEPAASSKGK